MPPVPVASSTGQTLLPDIGFLSYNGITFSALYSSKISGEAVKDEAGRTVKYMKYVIDVEGYVTLKQGDTSTDNTWVSLRRQLDAQGGLLTYQGKGFGPLVINAPGGALQDACWGPKPETLYFQPLGGSNAAMIRWSVTVCLPEYVKGVALAPLPPTGLVSVKPGAGRNLPPPLQFNYETIIGYDEDDYSTLTIRGTLEVPITRMTQPNRTIPYTVDDYREAYLDRVANSFDLTNFKVARRTFTESRDRRTMDWEFVAEELPYMSLPDGASRARGTFSVRPMKQGLALVNWICSLRVTYTIRKDRPRRLAWAAFISLLMFRIKASRFGTGPAPRAQQGIGVAANIFITGATVGLNNIFQSINVLRAQQKADAKAVPGGELNANIMGFEIDEGLYDDSRTITFGATWWLRTTFDSILRATAIWRWEGQAGDAQLWATNMRDIQGWRSWRSNRFLASQDAIVDFGATN